MFVWNWITKRPWKTAGVVAMGLLVIVLAPVLLAQARLDRQWVDNLAHMPKVELSSGAFALDYVSNWSYTTAGPATHGAVTFADTLANLRNVWFVVEPQPGGDYAAHTLVLFEFDDDRIVGLTIEARLEQGENYDAIAGAFNQYELSYIWSTARDLLTRRVTFLDKELYVYPLRLDPAQKPAFLNALLESTIDVSTNPRFYNTITSNCTNELAKVAGLGWHYSWVLTGYSPQRLFDLEIIPGETFEAAKQAALLTEPIASWNEMSSPDFDRALLAELRRRHGS